jgi:adenine-specific DNA-methyltransferase
MDLWYFFVCLGIDILKENGLLGFIAPNNWITNAGASILRNKIINETTITKYFDFADYMVFKNASIQTMVFTLKKEKTSTEYDFTYNKLLGKNILLNDLTKLLFENQECENLQSFNVKINPKQMQDKLITFVNSSLSKVLDKIEKQSNYKFDGKTISTGIDVHQDFVTDKHLETLKSNVIKKGNGIFVINDKEKKKLKLLKNEQSIVKPYYTTDELQRFYGNPKNKLWVIYSDMNVRKNIKKYPNIKNHLDKFKKIITSDFAPYGLHRAREQQFFEGTKIISLRKTSKPYFTYTEFPCYVSQTYFVIKPGDIDLKYLTAILNSKLIYFWL